MYVRLAFAVAAHLEPEILIVDEVLAVGDLQFQKKCLGKMGDVARAAAPSLFVSHNMAAINALCSRCVILDRGAVEFDGSTAEATTRYYAESLDFVDGSDLSSSAEKEAARPVLLPSPSNRLDSAWASRSRSLTQVALSIECNRWSSSANRLCARPILAMIFYDFSWLSRD